MVSGKIIAIDNEICYTEDTINAEIYENENRSYIITTFSFSIIF